jgi:hypothetical protein
MLCRPSAISLIDCNTAVVDMLSWQEISTTATASSPCPTDLRNTWPISLNMDFGPISSRIGNYLAQVTKITVLAQLMTRQRLGFRRLFASSLVDG